MGLRILSHICCTLTASKLEIGLQAGGWIQWVTPQFVHFQIRHWPCKEAVEFSGLLPHSWEPHPCHSFLISFFMNVHDVFAVSWSSRYMSRTSCRGLLQHGPVLQLWERCDDGGAACCVVTDVTVQMSSSRCNTPTASGGPQGACNYSC